MGCKMAKILVYNNATNRMETYIRGENERMPYNYGKTLTVGEFRGNSNSNTLWTDRTTMETWNQFRAYYGRPIPVGAAFKRPWEGGHSQQSQHYAGTAFDTGQQVLTNEQRAVLRQRARDFGNWSYIEPVSISPTWVHFDKRFGSPACSSGGFPQISIGSRGNYVLIAQDALNALGITGSGLDGYFGNGMKAAVTKFQSANGLSANGIVNCETWVKLLQKTVGIGRTRTVID
ncbi:MAG: peptidase [Bacillales bacterium]|nr:peptidase [Bacillales bacterium]